MIVLYFIYFIVFILLDIYSMDVSSFFFSAYNIFGLEVFRYIGVFIRQNTYFTRFIVLLPLLFYFAFINAIVIRSND
jgi:hypothetical protein